MRRLTFPLIMELTGYLDPMSSQGLAVSCLSPRLTLRRSRSILRTMTFTLWPDFTRTQLYEALLEFQKRERRYGGLAETRRRVTA